VIYSIDFETRSAIDLKLRGLDIYANDKSTEVLCIAFGTTLNDVTVVGLEQSVPVDELVVRWYKFNQLIEHVRAGGKIQAWNALFEYAIWNCVCVPKYGWPELKLSQVIDSMAIAAANNVPQSLEDAALFMNAAHKKDPIGAKLIQKLCKPLKNGNFNNDPELLQQLCEYCAKDVKAEMSIVAKLRGLSASEQAIWELTQRINLRGVPVDPAELSNACEAVLSAQGAIDQELLTLTGCKPSERAKLLAWLNAHGADIKDLTADTVTKKLDEEFISKNVRRALELRQEGSQTSVAKYSKMLEIQRNGRIRNTLVYHGASTGRWSSRGGLNLQNIARPTLRGAQIKVAIPRVFGQGVGTMSELSSLVRSALKAPDKQAFVDVDFSSIENRVGVWLAGQKDKVELFRQGLDEYKTFASTEVFHVPYDQVTEGQRQMAKSAVLGCMFGQGSRGLVEYADGMGVKMSLAQAEKAVNAYRLSYAKVKNLWYQCEEAAISAVQNPGTAFTAGSKIRIKCENRTLWLILPSKRLICWQRPQLDQVMTPWGQQKLAVTVHSQNTYTRQWGRNALIGSSIFQSATQGLARDFLAHASLNVEKHGYGILNLIHDEVLLLVDAESAEFHMDEVIKIMTTPPGWAPDMPLAAEGWHGYRYRK
jgi:DNA polymerase